MSASVIVLALIIGISLGLIGGGGSILTVPVLVYIAGINPVMATAYSLFIVGSTSLVGALDNLRRQTLHIPTAIIFSIPSFIAVYGVRRYLIPLIPDTVFTIGSWIVSKNLLIMLVFAVIMLAAAISMIKGRKDDGENVDIASIKFNYPLIVAEGFVVGALTGFVGAGGGFLIIPALVMFAKLPMRLAIGTSLLIISIKSLIGFIGDYQNLSSSMDWSLLLSFTGIAASGFFVGAALGKRIEPRCLKIIFGFFVLIMACFILAKELL